MSPNNLLVTSKRYILRKILQGEEERLQINESIEEPLLREVDDNSAESDDAELLVDEEPQKNPLLDYS